MIDPTSLIFAVGLCHLSAFVALWYFGLARRFPWLAIHLALEGVSQVTDSILPVVYGNSGAYRDMVWAWIQLPRMALRGMVVWEVSREATRRGLDCLERLGLWFLAGLACLLAGAISALVLFLTPGQPAVGWFAWAMLVRQYILMAFAAWLITTNAYLLWTRTPSDHNLMVYRAFATLSATVVAMAGSFVAGGLGYRFLPYTWPEWADVHTWQCAYSIILIGASALLVRPDEPEME